MAMKFRAHDTFFIRKGWLSKGLRNVKENPDVFITKDKSRNPMDVLGIGANMVKALRYWLQAVGLTEEPISGKRIQTLTKLGEIVADCDPFIEELGTLWILHYELIKDEAFAPSWYFFFNEFNMMEFTREEFVQSIQKHLLMIDEQVAMRSLNDDFACIINTYVPRAKSNPGKVSPENNIDCPLGELGLLDILSKDGKNITYRKSIPGVDSINPWVALAVIYDQLGDSTEVSLSTLLTQPNNIGRVFNLDSISMLELMHRAERTELIKIVRTAGLDYAKLEPGHSYMECIAKYYEEIIQ